jgi:hypothetical protein
MTIGNSLAALALCLAAHAAVAAEWGMAELMQSLAKVKHVKARFVEQKQLAILDKPLHSSGILEYAAGGRLEKRVLKPRPESLILENDQLTLQRGNQRRTMALRDNAVVGTFVESIRSTLAGDLGTLQKLFRTTLEGSPSKWRLQLVPLESRMLGFVTEVRIAGSGTWVDTVEFVEPQGDRSVMTILRDGA